MGRTSPAVVNHPYFAYVIRYLTPKVRPWPNPSLPPDPRAVTAGRRARLSVLFRQEKWCSWSTEEKRALAKQNGAEIVLGYYAEDREQFVKKVLEITGGEGVHAVFDSVGKDTFDSSLAVVRRKGTMVSFGNASGPVTGFSLA